MKLLAVLFLIVLLAVELLAEVTSPGCCEDGQTGRIRMGGKEFAICASGKVVAAESCKAEPNPETPIYGTDLLVAPSKLPHKSVMELDQKGNAPEGYRVRVVSVSCNGDNKFTPKPKSFVDIALRFQNPGKSASSPKIVSIIVHGAFILEPVKFECDGEAQFSVKLLLRTLDDKKVELAQSIGSLLLLERKDG